LDRVGSELGAWIDCLGSELNARLNRQQSDLAVLRNAWAARCGDCQLEGPPASSSNCRNQPCYPVLEWEVMNMGYACTGRTARWITGGVRQLS
jgi:hypothetical protein